MKRQKKERNWGKIFTIAVLLSFMAPIGYLVVRIISGDTADGVGRGREDYVLMLFAVPARHRGDPRPDPPDAPLGHRDPARDVSPLHRLSVLRDLSRRGAQLLLHCAALGHDPARVQRRDARRARLLDDRDLQ